MLMLTRRARRTSALTAAIAVGMLAAVVTAAPAAAVGGGFDPQAAPVTIPGTSTVVDEWKLVGKASASAVQIAPQWILAAGHAPLGPGGIFTNAYGSSTVDKLVGVCGPQFSGCDISVSHLSTPIAAPAYPALLRDGVPDGGPGHVAAGNTLVVGMGGSTLGRPTAAWTQPGANRLTLSTLQAGVQTVNGDSGGGAFYYYPGSGTGVLQGLLTSASLGATGGVTSFTSAPVKAFLDGALPAGTVNWVTYDQLGPRRFVPDTVATPTVAATPTAITLTWPSVAADLPILGYRAVLIQANNVHDARVITTSNRVHIATFTGLPSGVPFGAFVLASNAEGESAVPFTGVTNANPLTLTYPTTVALSPPPSAPTGVTASSGPNRLDATVTLPADVIPGVTTTELVVGRCDSGSCAASSTTPVADVTFTGTGISVPLAANTPAGTQFQIQARERNTVGVSAAITTTITYLPQAAPVPPASVTVAPQADGTATVSFVAAPADPVLPTGTVLAGYLQHAPALVYDVELHLPNQGTPLVVGVLQPGQQATVNVANLHLNPATYAVDVVAANAAWGDSAPVSVTARLGTVTTTPPLPVTTVRTPSAPPRPTGLVVPPVEFDGHNEDFGNTMTWTQPASGPGVATPAEFLITMRDRDNPGAPPTVAEVPATQHSYDYQVNFAHQYDVSVYAVDQQAGPSLPATAVGEGPGL